MKFGELNDDGNYDEKCESVGKRRKRVGGRKEKERERGGRERKKKRKGKRKKKEKKKGKRIHTTNGYEDRLRCSECAEWSRESHEQRLKRKGGNFF